MLYVNLIWIWGHPEVLHPGLRGLRHLLGSRFDLLGQAPLRLHVDGLRHLLITILSYIVWLHHFFTRVSGASVNSFFGITTDDHLDPDGREDVQLAVHDVSRPHQVRGPDAVDRRLHGDLRHRWHDRRSAAVPPADFVLHNSLFLIAHFHNVIIGGVVFGVFAGINIWFPKAFGFKLNAFWARCPSGSGSLASTSPSCRLRAWLDGRSPAA